MFLPSKLSCLGGFLYFVVDWIVMESNIPAANIDISKFLAMAPDKVRVKRLEMEKMIMHY